MWNCPKCGESLEDTFDACWMCAAEEQPPSPPHAEPAPVPAAPPQPAQQLAFRTFGNAIFGIDAELLQQAADFATRLGPDRVVSISHSEARYGANVVVWYWQPTAGE